MRRRPAEAHHHRERWLVSYADFITLLFALFVVMYALSTRNEGKYRVLSDALTAAFRHGRVTAPLPGEVVSVARISLPVARPTAKPGPNLRAQQEQKLQGLATRIDEAIRPLVQSGQVQLR